MTTKKGVPRGPKKEQAEESHKNTIIWIQMKNGMGIQNKQIAEMFGVSEGHVSRSINAFYKKMQDAFGPEYQEIVNEMISQSKKGTEVANRNNQEVSTDTRGASFSPGSLEKLTPSENLLATISMDQATKMAYAAGVVPAQAIELVARGLKRDDGRSREERGNDFIKGGSLLFGLAFGLLEGYQAMSEKNDKTTTINNGEEIE